MLKLQNLTVSVSGKEILHSLDFIFEKGKTYTIMGPNGSGKSTLAYTIMGHPLYIVEKKSKIYIDKTEISKLTPDKRAALGIFLSFQSPISLSGITVFQLLRLALSGKKDPLAVYKEMEKFSKELKIKEELLKRSLNDGASGGEKKKLEVLQAAVLNPKYVFFDEVDTGVDVDALKTIAQFINKYKANKTNIVITHYNRILKYLKPDYVLVLKEGRIVKVGDYSLVKQIEKNGYEKI
ncbi:MAG: Fe-S cluster assembly ATPase SufC [bacterium]|nr:Fe-S cluster assembly ATPase SufC [bacterium]